MNWMSEIYEHIAATIKKLRDQRKWSQEALAGKLGETANTISRWETGTYKPTAAHLEKLAKLFDRSITIFFPGSEQSAEFPSALLSATRGLKQDELKAVIEYAEFAQSRSVLKREKKHKK
jgi:transcriptional regulator with XRE-family HTH domain